MPPDSEAIAEQVFVALADPSRRAILAALAAGGPATGTDLAGRLPITRQAIAKHLALLAEAGLVTAEPGERRRVRYRLRSAPMQVAQQFLAALARDWDGPLGALRDHLNQADRHQPEGGQDNEDSIDRDAAGMGGGATGSAGQGEGADPGQGRAGGGASADAVAGG
jgi:DNA-binding transcriptional ArsR family regulator